MAHLRKPRKRGGKWLVRFVDEHGNTCDRTAFTDKGLSLRLMHQLEEEIVRKKLGLNSVAGPAREVTLDEHLTAFEADMTAKDRTARWVRAVLWRLRYFFQLARVTQISQISQDRLNAALNALTGAQERSARTRNHYVAALRQFDRWGQRNHRWDRPWTDQLENVRLNENNSRQRRGLTVPEVYQLIEAAKTRGLSRYDATHRVISESRRREMIHCGQERAVVYRFAVWTGLRLNEIRTLRWCDVQLDGELPCVLVEARNAKGRRRERLPLHASVVQALRAWKEYAVAELRRSVVDSERVFQLPRALLTHFKKDCVFAGIPLTNETGQSLVFHSLRHTTSTLLSLAGVPPAITQAIMRHEDIATTMKSYTHIHLQNLHQGIEKLGQILLENNTSLVPLPRV